MSFASFGAAEEDVDGPEGTMVGLWRSSMRRPMLVNPEPRNCPKLLDEADFFCPDVRA